MIKTVMMLFCFYSSYLFAHSEKLTVISGDRIFLKSIHHSFSGSIKNRLVSGIKKKGQFESELTVIENDVKTVSVFKSMDKKSFGGTLKLGSGENQKNYLVEFVGLDRNKDIFSFRFHGKLYEVSVTADNFENHHYTNPKYSINVAGKVVSFQLQNGKACYGYSVHLISMIFPVYLF